MSLPKYPSQRPHPFHSKFPRHGLPWPQPSSQERKKPYWSTPPTITQGHELAAWIKSVIPNKNLTTVFITHGHGDHYFTLTSLLEHFPDARVVETPATIKHMAQQVEPNYYNAYWGTWFPNQIQPPTSTVHPLSKDSVIELEGHKMHVIEAGHSDTENTSFLHVPDLNLVVAGDICYNDVHQWLVEATTEEKRNVWIAALEKIAALKPGMVIASHKRLGAVDEISNVRAMMATCGLSGS